MRAAWIAASTSRAAPSMLRDRSNCSTTLELPTALCEVISVTPAIVPRWRSSGVVTLVATVSGLAPGSEAETTMVGRSTFGNGDTGSRKKATPPDSANPIVSRGVATGRRMKGSAMLMARSVDLRCRLPVRRPRAVVQVSGARTAPAHGAREPVEVQVDHRRGEQGQQLTHQQAADDRYAQRCAQLRAGTGAQHQRQRGKQRGDRGHEDRAKTQQRGLVDRLLRRSAALALGGERKVDHHDRVLLDDTDQQDDADDRDDVQIEPG